ncbi:MAG: asparagine synthase (glutamine-hydrolyzing) [Planctomycetota bacterium]|nr:asparagine synthase (glutamine-hydrolyzing) [Planctomycetota bacterium]
MCGILGIVNRHDQPCDISAAELIRMRDTMTSRGPDGAGVLQTKNIAFAHRRLAIRDIQHGAQPWVSDDGRFVLLYNGELYNDDELRRQLIARGHRFITNCDTEVVLAAYREWESSCVDHFRGMFALGVYDLERQKLFCARDRFGIKPLFLTELDGHFLFASSIAALIAHLKFVKRPNLNAISHYLTTFRLTLGRETLFEGIWQLLPGERLLLDDHHVHVERYWDYPEQTETDITYDEAVERLNSLLDESIRGQLLSDVPVGMFLSGGVDSNTLAGLMKQQRGQPFAVVCGGGETEDADDFPYSRACAGHLQLDYDEARLGPENYLEGWHELIDHYATPVSTPSDVIIARMARHIKPSAGVVLCGEGADELLCGYAVQHWSGIDFDLAENLHYGTWPVDAATRLRYAESLKKHYGKQHFASPVAQYFDLNSLIPTATKAALFRPEIWQQLNDDRPMYDTYLAAFVQWGERPTSEKLHRLLHRVNLEALLARLDSATMSAGLEGRVPYTDHRLVEEMFRMPRSFRIDVDPEEPSPYLAAGELHQRGSLRSKRMLRTLADRLLPRQLARRPKASFPTPVQSWMSRHWHNEIREKFQTSPFGRELFREEILHAAGEHPEQIGMRAWPIWNLLEWGDQHFTRAA